MQSHNFDKLMGIAKTQKDMDGSRTFKRGLTRTSKMTSYQCILHTSTCLLTSSLHRGLYTVSNSEFGNFVITLRSILSKFMHIPFIQAH